jgi:hypothetical protein
VTRHVSPELLALHREGAVTAAKAASIDAHLAGCPRCSGIDAALTNLPSVLAATELPPMPDALTLRIQMAIARESAARAEASPASAAPAPAESALAGAGARAAGATAGTAGAGAGSARIPGRPDLPERSRSRSRRFRRPDWSSPLLLRGLAAAAVVVVIAGAGILLANVHTASQPAGSTANGAGARAPAARPSGAGGVNRQGSFSARASAPMIVSYRLNGRIATTNAVVSNANLTMRSLPRMVRKQVASVTKLASGAAAPGNQRAASPKARIGGVSMSALQGCLSMMARGRTVMLVSVARFLGRPATIVVLKSLTAANVFDVGIVGAGCSASNLDIIRMLSIPVR